MNELLPRYGGCFPMSKFERRARVGRGVTHSAPLQHGPPPPARRQCAHAGARLDQRRGKARRRCEFLSHLQASGHSHGDRAQRGRGEPWRQSHWCAPRRLSTVALAQEGAGCHCRPLCANLPRPEAALISRRGFDSRPRGERRGSCSCGHRSGSSSSSSSHRSGSSSSSSGHRSGTSSSGHRSASSSSIGRGSRGAARCATPRCYEATSHTHPGRRLRGPGQ